MQFSDIFINSYFCFGFNVFILRCVGTVPVSALVLKSQIVGLNPSCYSLMVCWSDSPLGQGSNVELFFFFLYFMDLIGWRKTSASCRRFQTPLTFFVVQVQSCTLPELWDVQLRVCSSTPVLLTCGEEGYTCGRRRAVFYSSQYKDISRMSAEICCHLNYLPVVSHWSVVSVSVQFTEAGGVKKKSVSRKKQKPNKHDDAILFILA